MRGAGQFLEQGTVFVGVWTGPDADLLCVKRQDDRVWQARRWCAPPGRTILDACVRGLLVYGANTLVDRLWGATRRSLRKPHPSLQDQKTRSDGAVAGAGTS